MERYRSILIVALIGLALYFFVFRKKDSGPPPEQHPVATVPEPASRPELYEEVPVTTKGLTAYVSSFSGAVKHLVLTQPQFRVIQKGVASGSQMDIASTWNEDALPLRSDLYFARNGQNLAPAYLTFRVERRSESEVELVANLKDAQAEVRRTIKAHGDYSFLVTTRVTNLGTNTAEVRISQNIEHYVRRKEESGGFMRQSYLVSEGICQRSDGKTFRAKREDMTQRGRANDGYTSQANYVALGNLYFVQALIPQGSQAACLLSGEDRGTVGDPTGTLLHGRLVWSSITLDPGQSRDYSTVAYFGPKMTEAMKAAHPGLVATVDLGWFALIARGLLWLLVKLYSVVGNWGVAIILLTVIVRLSLYPLLARGVKSAADMQRLKPELDAINAKYKEDQEARGLATMELYRKHKINPVSGCLPSLAQLPVWWALYSTLQTSVELFHAPFLTWKDLSASDPYFALPLILGVVMLVQQKLMPPAMPDPVQAKIMMYFMPVFFTVISLFLPAGLALYMLVNSLLAMVQQKITKVQVDKLAASAGPITSEVTANPAVVETPSPRGTRSSGRGGRRGGRR